MRAILITILCAQMASLPALAQPLSQPTSAPTSQPSLLELPTGKVVQRGAEKLRGYTLEEFKVILKIHASYKSWGKQVPHLKGLVSNLTELSQNYSKQLKLTKEQLEIANKDRDRLTKKWTEENWKRHLAENKPAFGSWVAWGAAAGFAALSVVLVSVIMSKD